MDGDRYWYFDLLMLTLFSTWCLGVSVPAALSLFFQRRRIGPRYLNVVLAAFSLIAAYPFVTAAFRHHQRIGGDVSLYVPACIPVVVAFVALYQCRRSNA